MEKQKISNWNIVEKQLNDCGYRCEDYFTDGRFRCTISSKLSQMKASINKNKGSNMCFLILFDHPTATVNGRQRSLSVSCSIEKLPKVYGYSPTNETILLGFTPWDGPTDEKEVVVVLSGSKEEGVQVEEVLV